MALIVYATADYYAQTWTKATAPDNLDLLLRSASIRVAWACDRNPYTDEPGADAADPLRDATCAAVAAWQAVGIDPNAGGLDLQIKKQIKLLSGSVDYDTAGRLPAQQQAAAMIGEEARQILLATSLLYVALPLSDPNPTLNHYGLSGPYPWFGSWDKAQATDAFGDVESELRTVVIENPGNA